VTDTGVGIADDKKEDIFKRFGQADDFYFKNAMGTGLGLAISKDLVEIMGGKIWFKSKLMKGTTFYFTTPYNPIENTGHVEPKIVVPESDTDLQDKIILIAEDEEMNYIFFYELFSIKKIAVDWVKNGQEAVDKISGDNHYDLILMDIKMPIMDGVEAMQKIKKLNKKVPPIIAQTAFAISEEKEKYLSLGFDDYISKPINIDELFTKVNKWMARDI